MLEQRIEKGQPIALLGSFSEGIDPSLLHLAGLQLDSSPIQSPVHACSATSRLPELVSNVSMNFSTFCRPENVSATPHAKVIYTEEGSPALTLNETGGSRIAAWDAPTLRSIQEIPLSQIWGNTGAPFALAAGTFNNMLQAHSDLHVDRIDLRQTMNISAWRTADGKLRILAGNLEEGLRDDADMTRHATLVLPKSWQGGSQAWKDAWTGHTLPVSGGSLHVDLPQASSVLLQPTQ
jgi:hypothetical protein